jgi:hypothetical protein
MDTDITLERAAQLLDISAPLLDQLIKAGVVRKVGTTKTTTLIPSHEVSRVLRVGFVPFAPIAADPQTNNSSHETARTHLIESATRSQTGTRRLKTLQTATLNGDIETIKRLKAEAELAADQQK